MKNERNTRRDACEKRELMKASAMARFFSQKRVSGDRQSRWHQTANHGNNSTRSRVFRWWFGTRVAGQMVQLLPEGNTEHLAQTFRSSLRKHGAAERATDPQLETNRLKSIVVARRATCTAVAMFASDFRQDTPVTGTHTKESHKTLTEGLFRQERHTRPYRIRPTPIRSAPIRVSSPICLDLDGVIQLHAGSLPRSEVRQSDVPGDSCNLGGPSAITVHGRRSLVHSARTASSCSPGTPCTENAG